MSKNRVENLETKVRKGIEPESDSRRHKHSQCRPQMLLPETKSHGASFVLHSCRNEEQKQSGSCVFFFLSFP